MSDASSFRRVDLWLAEPLEASAERDATRAEAAVMTSDERQRYLRLRRAYDRALFLTARLVARVALARTTGTAPSDWRLAADTNGRPLALGPERADAPALSLSHTGGLVVCATTRHGLVGVDVERRDREFDPLAMARRALAPAELEDLLGTPEAKRTERFLEYWTSKEAVLKALGVGLRVSLASIAIDLRDPCGVAMTLLHGAEAGEPMRSALREGAAGGWALKSFRPTPEHVAAVAISVAEAPRVGGDSRAENIGRGERKAPAPAREPLDVREHWLAAAELLPRAGGEAGD